MYFASSSLSDTIHGCKHLTTVSYLPGVGMISLILINWSSSTLISTVLLLGKFILSTILPISAHALVVPRLSRWKLPQSLHKQPVSIALRISHGALLRKSMGAVFGILTLHILIAISTRSRTNFNHSLLIVSNRSNACLDFTCAGYNGWRRFTLLFLFGLIGT